MQKLRTVKTIDGSVYVIKAADLKKYRYAWIDARPKNEIGDFSWEISPDSIIATQKVTS